MRSRAVLLLLSFSSLLTVWLLYNQYVLRDHVDVIPDDAVVHTWRVTKGPMAPDGVTRNVYLINGQSPGPELHSLKGDVLRVTVVNELVDESVSMHWHGVRQRGTNRMDGAAGITECGIPPGESFTYQFNLDEAGTFWYHAHHKFQRIEGLTGALIVYDDLKDPDPVVMIQDWYHDSAKDIYNNYMTRASGGFEPVPNSALINGKNMLNENGDFEALKLETGKETRLRLINSGAFADFKFSIDEHELTVIEADSCLVEPETVHFLTISPGQRYSVLVTPRKPAMIRAEMSERNFQYFPPVYQPRAIAFLNSDGGLPQSKPWASSPDAETRHLNPNLLNPLVYEAPPEPDIRIIVTSQTIKLEKVDLAPFAFFNRTTWTPAIGAPNLHVALRYTKPTIDFVTLSKGNKKYGGSQLVQDIPYGAVVELVINNPDDTPHPMHLHGHDFWIMHTRESSKGLGSWSPKYIPHYRRTPIKRDTHVVPSLGHTVIRWVADNPGIWALHCHVIWHHAAGLLMQFAEGMNKCRERIPRAQLEFCKRDLELGQALVEPLPMAPGQ